MKPAWTCPWLAPRVRSIALAVAAFSAVAAFALGLGAGCARRPHDADEKSADGSAPVAITVATVEATGADGSLLLPGRVEARSEVTLEARVSGRVTRLARREGESFRAGETLAEFAAPEAATALAAARARLASAVATDERTARQEARLDSLHARGVVALRDLELAESAARAASAEHAAAAAELERWTSGTRLVAPFAGVVVRRRVDPGADVPAGQPVLDLRSHEVGDVAVDLPESFLDRVDGATFELAAGDGAWRAARLVRVEGMIDPTSRSRRAWVSPRSEGAARAGLEPGAFVRVRITAPGRPSARESGGAAATQPAAIIVPSRSIVRRGGLAGVYVIDGDRARLRWVRLGRVSGDAVEVAAGLAAGDRYAVDPAGLADGRRVSARP